MSVERLLRALIERDSEVSLGVTFLATEYSTGKAYGFPVDTLAIDEDDCPLIIEYKRSRVGYVFCEGHPCEI